MLILYQNYSGMVTGSKIRFFSISSVIVFLLVSCEKNKNDVIPDVYVEFTIDLRDYPSLESITGSAFVDANDMRISDRKYAGGFDGNGIILYRSNTDEILAYDRTCPHDYEVKGLSKKVNVDFTQAVCPECGTHYSLYSFGQSSADPGQYPLKNYKTSFSGYYVRVWNDY
jgi:nitrite reductase/ring-hydroxylating ferredoxin subunit